MAIDVITYALAKKYTDETVVGGGAIKGKNAIIESITPITGGNKVKFKWTLDDGSVLTSEMNVMDGNDGEQGEQGPQGPQGPAGINGSDGVGIDSVLINEFGHLIVTYDDGTTKDAGEIPGGSGEVNSVNGKKGDVTLTASDVGALPDDVDIPTKTSDLTNDSNYISDSSYVHTDNNYTNADKESLAKIPLDIDALQASLLNKVDKVPGKGLSENDFTSNDKSKLDGLLGIKSAGAGLNFNDLTGELTATGSSMPIDQELDPTSVNPVQNKAIAIPFEALQASLLNVKSNIPTKTSDLTNDSNYISDSSYVHTDNNYTNADKESLAKIPLDIDALSGSLLNKANKSELPTKTSDLTNDSGFITNTVNNLVNYYLKTEVYTRTDVDALINAISTINISLVETLPTTDISTSTIYLVPKASAQSSNIKDEYINITGDSSGWEKIGDTEIDLSDYVTDSELTSALANYVTITNLTTLLAAKQDVINDLATIRNGASAGATAYQKPLSGIPKSDLTNDVQTSLDRADSAIQEHQSLANYIQKSSTSGLVRNDGTIDTNTYANVNNLATVATSGSYDDLEDQPTIQSIEIGSTGTASDTGIHYQRIRIDSVYTAIDGTKYMEQDVTTSTSAVTVATFTNSEITTDTVIDYYCSEWNLVPDSIVCNNGTCAVTLPVVDTASTVTIRIYLR